MKKNWSHARRSGRHDDAGPFERARNEVSAAATSFWGARASVPSEWTNSEISRAVRSPPIVSGGDQRQPERVLGFLPFATPTIAQCLIQYYNIVIHHYINIVHDYVNNKLKQYCYWPAMIILYYCNTII